MPRESCCRESVAAKRVLPPRECCCWQNGQAAESWAGLVFRGLDQLSEGREKDILAPREECPPNFATRFVTLADPALQRQLLRNRTTPPTKAERKETEQQKLQKLQKLQKRQKLQKLQEPPSEVELTKSMTQTHCSCAKRTGAAPREKIARLMLRGDKAALPAGLLTGFAGWTEGSSPPVRLSEKPG